MGAYSTAVLADSPVGFWKMGEAALPMANSGSDGSASQLDHDNGSALPTFNSLALVGTETDKNPLNPNNGFFSRNSTGSQYNFLSGTSGTMSVECWIKPTSATLTGTTFLIAKGNPQQWALSLVSGQVRFFLGATGSPIQSVTGGTTLVAGNIYHIVGTINMSAPSIAVYVNGVADGSNTSTTGGSTSATIDLPWVGWNQTNSASGSCQCTIGWAAIYSTTLSSTRVAAHFSASQPVVTTVDFTSLRPAWSRYTGRLARSGRSFQAPLAPGVQPISVPTLAHRYQYRFVPALGRTKVSTFQMAAGIPPAPFTNFKMRGGPRWVPWLGRRGSTFRPGFIPSGAPGLGFPTQTARPPWSRLGLGPAPSRRGHEFIPPQALQQAGHIVINTASRNLDFVSVRVQPEGIGLAGGGAFLPTTEILTTNAAGTWVCYILPNTVFSDPTMFYLFTEYYKDGRTQPYKARFPAGAPSVVFLKDYLI